MANDAEWITRYRQTVTSYLQVQNTLNALRAQWDALDYGNTLTAEDFAGANQDITLADLTAAVSSVEAIDTFVSAGHTTNLYRLVV